MTERLLNINFESVSWDDIVFSFSVAPIPLIDLPLLPPANDDEGREGGYTVIIIIISLPPAMKMFNLKHCAYVSQYN